MPAPDPLALFLEPLERLAFPYCVTGSVASSVYGQPRLTADIDVVLLLDPGGIEPLRAAFPESAYYVPTDETLRLQLARGDQGMFNLIHHASQFKADIYLAADDPLHAWALANRRRIDIGFILAATPIDRGFVEAEVEKLGVGTQWRGCQS